MSKIDYPQKFIEWVEERLIPKESWEYWYWHQWISKEELLSSLEKLNEKFPCGHRVSDWDDSYGN